VSGGARSYLDAARSFSALSLALTAACSGSSGAGLKSPGEPRLGNTIRVEIAASSALNSFSPLRALGAGIDRFDTGTVDLMFSKPMLEPVMSSGWGAVSYRLNTELHVEAWHWNPTGSWSMPNQRGYFTGDPQPNAAIKHSFGFPLPRRGFTRNEGTEAVGFSRLTDGARDSFWKSNPYLASAFTGEDETPFPQWIVIDLGTPQAVDTLGIDWAEPYAKSYQVQYFTGPEAMKRPADGEWRAFPAGDIRDGHGGAVTHKLAATASKVRFVRVLMNDSSQTCVAGDSTDRRNCVGYAINEVHLGTLSATGQLKDAVRHAPDQTQTATYCSSVDPWHSAADLDQKAGELPGLDLFFDSGVTRGLPAMVPVSTLYGTPEDSAAEIAYLETRGYPISYVELGEEADGQYATPEHYAALYLQWASAIHRVDPLLLLGGPAFTGFNEDIKAWPDAHGNNSWFGRFLDYLKAHKRLADLSFMSFEHYPYDPCKATWDSLYDEPKLISHSMQVWRDDGLPKDVPMLVTEVNLSSAASQASVDTFGGLWLADYVGAFLSAGGKGSFYFHYLPFPLDQECDETWGTHGMFKSNAAHRIEQPTSQYFASQLLNQEWVQPVDATHTLFPTQSDVIDVAGRTVVTAYAVRRPDQQWSVLLVNKDPMQAHAVQVRFHDAGARRDRAFTGPVALRTFGADNYHWLANGAAGHADPDGPVAASEQPGGEDVPFTLPRASITVLRGSVE
jgi:hypothetical protein